MTPNTPQAMPQITHSENCYTQGPKHYECALAQIEALKAEVSANLNSWGKERYALMDELAAAKRDGERLDLLERKFVVDRHGEFPHNIGYTLLFIYRRTSLRNAIDAAIEQGQPKDSSHAQR